MADLKAFKAFAEKFGAAEVETSKHDEENVAAGRQKAADTKFRWWASADTGGCGSPGCHCSPGLWVAASQGEEIAIAHFGEGPFKRGSEGFFTRKDYLNWLKFQAILR